MKNYTEQDLRKAFQAGHERGCFDNAGNYFDAPLDEDEYIESLSHKKDEEEIIFSYSFLCRKLNWLEFCELTGTSEWAKREGYDPQPNDLFYIPKSKAIKFNLI